MKLEIKDSMAFRTESYYMKPLKAGGSVNSLPKTYTEKMSLVFFSKEYCIIAVYEKLSLKTVLHVLFWVVSFRDWF